MKAQVSTRGLLYASTHPSRALILPEVFFLASQTSLNQQFISEEKTVSMTVCALGELGGKGAALFSCSLQQQQQQQL